MALAVLLRTAGAVADSPSYAVSDVKGVQLWLLREGQQEVFVDPASEFVRHCDGGPRALLHVGSVPSPVPCKAARMPSGDYRIQLDAGSRVLPPVVVVSMTALPERVKPPPPDEAELKALLDVERAARARFAADARRDFLANYGGSTAQYDQRLAAIEASARYRSRAASRWKLNTPRGPVYLSPLGAAPDAIGWDLVYAVYQAGPQGLKETGRFAGCVEGFRDVDGDGVPDVFTTTCENDEGVGYAFISVAGPIQRLMSH